MLPPVEVTPPLSNAFRYSIATDFRCSSVIVWMVSAMIVSCFSAARIRVACGLIHKREVLTVSARQLFVRAVRREIRERQNGTQRGPARPIGTCRRRCNAIADAIQTHNRSAHMIEHLSVGIGYRTALCIE